MPYFSERDIEIPELLKFADEHSNKINTILDVGCYGSQYLDQLKQKNKIIDGIDLAFGKKEKEFLRNYFVGNILDKELEMYDLAICLSTLEHSGIEQYQVKDYKAEQVRVFKKIIDIADHFIFLTVPYGAEALVPGFYANMTKARLAVLLGFLDNFNISLEFYFQDKTQPNSIWILIDQDKADLISFDPKKAVQCVCILKAIKKL